MPTVDIKIEQPIVTAADTYGSPLAVEISFHIAANGTFPGQIVSGKTTISASHGANRRVYVETIVEVHEKPCDQQGLEMVDTVTLISEKLDPNLEINSMDAIWSEIKEITPFTTMCFSNNIELAASFTHSLLTSGRRAW